MVALILIAETLTIAISPSLKVTAVQKGVSAGDYFTYGRSDGKPWIWRTPSNTPILSQWNNFVNMSTITFKIINSPLAGPYDVFFNQTNRYENQTEKEITSWVNLDTAAGGGYLFFISAGLGKDKIYPHPYNENITWSINETRTDPDWGERTICFFNLTRVTQGTMTTVAKTIIMWDQLTGALLSVYDAKAATLGPSNGIIEIIESGVFYELIDTNRFSIQHSGGGVDMTPIYAIVGVSIIVAGIILAVRLSANPSKKKWKRPNE
jgi:hypothetical protein